MLPPPEAVKDMRSRLGRAKVPHQLLSDLLEPDEEAAADRKALESFLGELRFAIAVPDTQTFVQAVEIAREARFPFYVLAPDVRSPRPTTGDHPLLDAVLVFTSGFLGRAERAWLARVAAVPGVKRVRHWGDLDPGGLLIYRQIRDLLAEAAPAVTLEPYRMDASALLHPAAAPLSERDRERLSAYLAAPDPPLTALAEAMLERGVKLEQEALLLD